MRAAEPSARSLDLPFIRTPTALRSWRATSVATGPGGHHFHRHQRCPGPGHIRPVRPSSLSWKAAAWSSNEALLSARAEGCSPSLALAEGDVGPPGTRGGAASRSARSATGGLMVTGDAGGSGALRDRRRQARMAGSISGSSSRVTVTQPPRNSQRARAQHAAQPLQRLRHHSATRRNMSREMVPRGPSCERIEKLVLRGQVAKRRPI
jgi:hypothetical protein